MAANSQIKGIAEGSDMEKFGAVANVVLALIGILEFGEERGSWRLPDLTGIAVILIAVINLGLLRGWFGTRKRAAEALRKANEQRVAVLKRILDQKFQNPREVLGLAFDASDSERPAFEELVREGVLIRDAWIYRLNPPQAP